MIAAGLPAILAAQNPYNLPSYPQGPSIVAPTQGMPLPTGAPAGMVNQQQSFQPQLPQPQLPQPQVPQPQWQPTQMSGNATSSIPVAGGLVTQNNIFNSGNNGLPAAAQSSFNALPAPNISAPVGAMVVQQPNSSMPTHSQFHGYNAAAANGTKFGSTGRLVSNSTVSGEPTMSTSEAFDPSYNSDYANNANCQTCGPDAFAHSAAYGYGGYNGNGLPWCEGPSNSGCFASLEALLFFVNKPTVATFGDEASERIVSVNGITYRFENSLDSSWLSNDGAWGQRLDFGNINQDCGWFVSLWNVKQAQTYNTPGVSFVPADPNNLMSGFVDGNGDSIDDDLDGDSIYGRSGRDLGTFDAGPPPGFIAPLDGVPDVGAPLDTGDMVSWLQTFDNVVASNKLTLINVELNRLYRVAGHSWANEIDYYYGIRYLQVKDIYNITANGNFLDQSVWNAESDNNLIGPQLGLRWSRRNRAVGFSVDGRFFAAYNRQDNDLRGFTASNFAATGAANGPAALTSGSFVDGFGNDAFSPVGELRADMILKMSRSWAFKVGYTGLVAGEISRSSPKIVYALPRSSLTDVESDTTLISHGVNFGLEYNR
jgi:hypothetical protein